MGVATNLLPRPELPAGHGYPAALVESMIACWAHEPHARPAFDGACAIACPRSPRHPAAHLPVTLRAPSSLPHHLPPAVAGILDRLERLAEDAKVNRLALGVAASRHSRSSD